MHYFESNLSVDEEPKQNPISHWRQRQMIVYQLDEVSGQLCVLY